MFDDGLELLLGTPQLRDLLGHYAQAGAADREAWLDRVMVVDGLDARDLVRLHGLLLAMGWLEQNTGNTPGREPGVVAACYRVTPFGYRALKHVEAAPAARPAA